MKFLTESNSQSGQESFVLHMTNYKNSGTYLEIGAWDGLDLSNTYFLETKYGWTGIALDIVQEYAERYASKRKNMCLLADATTVDFEQILTEHEFPDTIDYLQLDIEPAENTYKCLIRIPFNKYQFRVITFEHDLYFSGDNQVFKDKALSYLTALGYARIADNVQNQNNAYEDWYVNESLTPTHLLVDLPSNSNYQIFFES
jgi:hypothetical protein